ncbi:drug/metabolite exporter YedA [Chitiniphilus shinanonensis]|uniref:Drug/metabolite exporter YedA n=1 Tax=Chitiniphilus shinanonensis TaxID=553088 RepID=A0ABQ6BRG1_9NEIS|nr:drug/metabolite exporter YedA [Chitiniphilus shinanonensis]GLS04032.1 drug/metabolite exporter YedA [Chitiniphilus shinanonensis]
MKTLSPRLLLPLCLLMMYVVWGSTYLAIRIAVAEMPPLLLAAMRFLAAGGLMLAFLRWRGVPWPRWAEVRNAGIMGLLMLGVGNGAVCVAEETVPSGLAALLVACGPLFAILIAWAWGSRPRAGEWLGIALGLGGVAILNFDAHLAASPKGFILIVIAAATWAFASVLQARIAMPAGPMSAAIQMAVGGVGLALVSAASGERLPAEVHWHGWAALAYLTVFGSLVAYNAYVYVLRHARPALAMSYAYVNPAIAVALGALLADEVLSLPIGVGMAVILGGVVLIALGNQRH